ncbi:MAG: hypothetical protein KJ563_02365 [Candidatus Thermoplasmatota archaeon]|nr:hypothetical protein [Candidatus Thermoplasmatota archaeon]
MTTILLLCYVGGMEYTVDIGYGYYISTYPAETGKDWFAVERDTNDQGVGEAPVRLVIVRRVTKYGTAARAVYGESDDGWFLVRDGGFRRVFASRHEWLVELERMGIKPVGDFGGADGITYGKSDEGWFIVGDEYSRWYYGSEDEWRSELRKLGVGTAVIKQPSRIQSRRVQIGIAAIAACVIILIGQLFGLTRSTQVRARHVP